MLLSHTSSLRDGDDAYVIPLGGSLEKALADPAVWDAAHGPDDIISPIPTSISR